MIPRYTTLRALLAVAGLALFTALVSGGLRDGGAQAAPPPDKMQAASSHTDSRGQTRVSNPPAGKRVPTQRASAKPRQAKARPFVNADQLAAAYPAFRSAVNGTNDPGVINMAKNGGFDAASAHPLNSSMKTWVLTRDMPAPIGRQLCFLVVSSVTHQAMGCDHVDRALHTGVVFSEGETDFGLVPAGVTKVSLNGKSAEVTDQSFEIAAARGTLKFVTPNGIESVPLS